MVCTLLFTHARIISTNRYACAIRTAGPLVASTSAPARPAIAAIVRPATANPTTGGPALAQWGPLAHSFGLGCSRLNCWAICVHWVNCYVIYQ